MPLGADGAKNLTAKFSECLLAPTANELEIIPKNYVVPRTPKDWRKSAYKAEFTCGILWRNVPLSTALLQRRNQGNEDDEDDENGDDNPDDV